MDQKVFLGICIAYGIAMALVYSVVDSNTVRLTVTLVGAGIVAISAISLKNEDA